MVTPRPHRSSVVFLASVITFMSFLAPGWAQTSIDPQSLVGEWSGEWVWRAGGAWRGPMDMTILKVEKNVVYASGSYRGGAQGARTWKSTGTLEGNTLRIGRSTYTVGLDAMTGFNDSSDLTLRKVK